MSNLREVALQALLRTQTEGVFLNDSLLEWEEGDHPSEKDFRLAQEISYGTMRMKKALDFLLRQLVSSSKDSLKDSSDSPKVCKKPMANGKLNIKRKEKMILSMAMYQYFYMDKIPIYAIVNESVTLAKKYCHARSIPFINALLRKLEATDLSLPESDSLEDLTIRYSYPKEYVSLLIEEYGIELAKNLLHLGNLPPVLMGRVRGNTSPHFSYVIQEPLFVVKLDNLARISHKDSSKDGQDGMPDSFTIAREHYPTDKARAIGNEEDPTDRSSPRRDCEKSGLANLASNTDIYIQNVTPVFLIGACSRFLKKKPKRILDMCASPGGKAIAIHDLFPEAFLHVNDISPQKMAVLKENLKKYKIDVHHTMSAGEELHLERAEDAYDLIIIDAPCSNSGVFNKRPEARWKFSEESFITKLIETQKRLIDHAKKLLSPEGQLWYFTCSILKEENESLVQAMHPIFQQTILPNPEGWDGGFGAVIR